MTLAGSDISETEVSASSAADAEAMQKMLSLLPPYALDVITDAERRHQTVSWFSGGAVRVDGGFVEMDVSKEVAVYLGRQRLLAYLIVKRACGDVRGCLADTSTSDSTCSIPTTSCLPTGSCSRSARQSSIT